MSTVTSATIIASTASSTGMAFAKKMSWYLTPSHHHKLLVAKGDATRIPWPRPWGHGRFLWKTIYNGFFRPMVNIGLRPSSVCSEYLLDQTSRRNFHIRAVPVSHTEVIRLRCLRCLRSYASAPISGGKATRRHGALFLSEDLAVKTRK